MKANLSPFGDKVLVTGATGHVGLTLTEMLCTKGYDVRVGVRDTRKMEKYAYERNLDVEIVKMELQNPNEIRDAVKGCDGVFHLAAVFKILVNDYHEEITKPNMEGTVNVITAAKENNVKRVIYTSSLAVMGFSESKDKPVDENSWNEEAKIPYTISKQDCERHAWQLVEENDLDLVVLNPGHITGPNCYRLTPTMEFLQNLLKNRLIGIPPMPTVIVDVRDVAKAHMLAYEKPNANGRYIVINQYKTLKELIEVAKDFYPSIRVPMLRPNVWMTRRYARFHAIISKIRGIRPIITPEMADEVAGKTWYCELSKTKKELGWEPMSYSQTLKDALDWVYNEFVNK